MFNLLSLRFNVEIVRPLSPMLPRRAAREGDRRGAVIACAAGPAIARLAETGGGEGSAVGIMRQVHS